MNSPAFSKKDGRPCAWVQKALVEQGLQSSTEFIAHRRPRPAGPLLHKTMHSRSIDHLIHREFVDLNKIPLFDLFVIYTNYER